MYALQLNLLINILFERISIVAFKGRRQRYVQIYYEFRKILCSSIANNLLIILHASERELRVRYSALLAGCSQTESRTKFISN